MHDWLQRAALSAVLVVFISPVLGQQKTSEPTPVKTATVTVETLNVEVTAVGTLRADETVVVRPEIAGRVAAIHFKEGQASR